MSPPRKAARKGNGPKPAKRPRPPQVCTICDEPGHNRRTCPKRGLLTDRTRRRPR